MTIAATELSRTGIAMVVGDYRPGLIYPSGISLNSSSEVRMPLLRIPYLTAVVSAWGPHRLVASGVEGVEVDAWLNDLILHERSTQTMRAWAEMLMERLNSNAFELESVMGFHLAGHDEHNGVSVPTFFHITNQRDEPESPVSQEFVLLHEGLPPANLSDTRVFWNGGFNPFALETDAVGMIEAALETALGQSGQERSLEGRCARLASWVELLSALSTTYDERRAAPAQAMWFGITPDGAIISAQPTEGG